MNLRVNPRDLPAPTDPHDTRRVLDVLRGEVGADAFGSWFGRLEIERIEGTRAVVSVPTKFLKSWVASHYIHTMVRALRVVAPYVETVDVIVRSTATRGLAPLPAKAATVAEVAAIERPKPTTSACAPEPSSALCGSRLDRRLTFETFHVGPSNQLAERAARRVVAAGINESPVFNPLFVRGDVGLGKTHLLQAIASAAMDRGRVALYLTAEKFMYGFALALKAQTPFAFRAFLRDVDILLIDDVQFLHGKAVGAEFARTLDAVLDTRTQIVLAADRPPSELEGVDARIRSRLAGGLTVEITAPDLDVRTRMLEAKVAAGRRVMPGFEAGADVIAAVASLIQTNGRDLDGAMNRLMAHASLTQEPLTVATAELAIRDLISQRTPKRVKIDEIQRLVASHYNVCREDILSARRTANVVRPRQIAMYLSKVLTLRSLPEIGRRFGGRDHTTCLHAVRKIEGLLLHDKALDEEIKNLRATLEA